MPISGIYREPRLNHKHTEELEIRGPLCYILVFGEETFVATFEEAIICEYGCGKSLGLLSVPKRTIDVKPHVLLECTTIHYLL